MIENHVLHALTWSLLRILPPRKAFRWATRLGQVLPRIDSADEARCIAAAIDPHGTCLTRSLTLASRLRDAVVVIGVNPDSLAVGAAFAAHAWIEVGGRPLRPEDAGRGEIARLFQTHD